MLLRLGLTFFPAMLLGLVLLAGMVLASPRFDEGRAALTPAPPAPDDRLPARKATEATREGGFRSGLAFGVLAAGLGFTALAGMAVLVTLVFVLATR
jgi:hypothetical protein